MAKKPALGELFQPKHYQLKVGANTSNLAITGKVLGRPRNRITLHQKNLKILKVKIEKYDKNGSHQIEIDRINHIKSFEEVRLHTKQPIYAGEYTVELEFKTPAQLSSLTNQSADFTQHEFRAMMPSIDEPHHKASAAFDIL